MNSTYHLRSRKVKSTLLFLFEPHLAHAYSFFSKILERVLTSGVLYAKINHTKDCVEDSSAISLAKRVGIGESRCNG